MSLTPCVCGESFCLVGAFKAFEARCFEGVIRVLLGCSEESLMVFKRVFLVSFSVPEVSSSPKEFQWCFKTI